MRCGWNWQGEDWWMSRRTTFIPVASFNSALMAYRESVVGNMDAIFDQKKKRSPLNYQTCLAETSSNKMDLL